MAAGTRPDPELLAEWPGVFVSLTGESGTGPAVAVKDVIDVRGMVTTAGGLSSAAGPWPDGAGPERSPGGVAEADAPVVARLRDRGCLIVGKTNLHEFCLGPTSVNPHYGPVLNPHDRSRVAGGSSGGSAAAVALGLCDWAIGTDTSGSVRIPAALCGVVGLKPTTGLLDTTGVVPTSRTLDTIGVLAQDVAGSRAALDLLTDGTPAPPLEGLPRLAVPEGWDDRLAPDVAEAWHAVAADLPRVPFPDPQRFIAAGKAIIMTEAHAVHARRLALAPEFYGADVRDLLIRAATVPRRDYLHALAEAGALRVEVERALACWDALALPTTRITAPALDAEVVADDLTDLTRPFSVTGHPAVTLPLSVSGMPVGLQLVGRHGEDRQLLGIAAAVEDRRQKRAIPAP